IHEWAAQRLYDRERESLAVIAKSWQVQERLHDVISLNDAGQQYLDVEVGSHPAALPTDPLIDEGRVKRWYRLPIDRVIDEAVAEQGGSRSVVNLSFIADRRLEVLAHSLRRHPSVIAETRQRLALMPPDALSSCADALVSYLIGIAFGRWDARIARDETL